MSEPLTDYIKELDRQIRAGRSESVQNELSSLDLSLVPRDLAVHHRQAGPAS